MNVTLLVAADGAPWELDVVAALGRSSYGVTVARRCVDVVDLLAVAAAGHGRVALVSSGLRALDAETVDTLAAHGVAAVAVVPRGDRGEDERMQAIGITHVVNDDADIGVVASVVIDAAGRAEGGAVPQGGAADRSGEELSTVASAARDGTVVAVWGPTGAPGRTTVAVGLADAIARLAAPAFLIDLDVYGGTVAPMLGMLDDAPGVPAACRAASTTRLDARALSGLARRLAPSLHVLTGIPRAQRWSELRPPTVVTLLAAARALADWTVVDCGFALETDDSVGFDSVAPRRNGATLAALEYADSILAVGSCDPIGINRLVLALDELRDSGIGTPVRVVLNRVRGGVVAGDAAAEATAALARFAGVTVAAALPHDLPAVDACLAAGQLPSEAAAGSALCAALLELARTVTGLEGRATRRRRLARRAVRRRG